MTWVLHCAVCRRPTKARDRAEIAKDLLRSGTPLSEIVRWTCPGCVWEHRIAAVAEQVSRPPARLAPVIPLRR